ncbi:hypothetical protein K2173_015042 [Erythroxylum novogranatense]|uniref:anthocyanidin 3-O-glucosyltransferase n=1 Tax=Erythroxylum novogranatense TaxID=1862640 RepID=A0AAV8TUH4_9ROSI|nr:hypothetical protein K2173_015042 [Erythroxylum novogranatense]
MASFKPHAVLIPFPFQSHIKQILKLAKLLHYKGFHITFVNTEFNHQRFLRAEGSNSLDGSTDFRFETIPDGLPPSDSDASQDMRDLCEATAKNLLAPFLQLLDKLNNSHESSNVPSVTCIVADSFMPFTITAAEELKIPLVMFFTISACGLMGVKHGRHLMDKGLIPLKDESCLTNGYLENIVEGIPGMKGIRLRDFSSFVRTTDPNEFFLNFTTECTEKAVKASAILVHTFNALEQDVLDGLFLEYPRVYSIGPLQLLLNQVKEPSMKSVKHNFWKEETQCLAWLDSKAPNSVMYVNFGSLAVLTEQQLLEFGMGLANSKQHFLWIVRPDLVTGGSAILPKEFTELSEGRGFIASWCPQEEVLNHPSTGGFLTHCGWNSTLESLSAGVPMLCWPFFGDQTTNCRFACKEWGIGMEIDNDVKRDEVENLVRELMEGERGKKLKNKAMELKKLAEKATGPNGSSRVNLDKLVNEQYNQKLLNYQKTVAQNIKPQRRSMASFKPHVVLIPFPFQSHVKQLLKLAKLLHNKGFHVTFVNTEFNHQRFLRAEGSNSLDGSTDFRFETIPDGLPPSDPNASQDMRGLCESTANNLLAPFVQLLDELNESSSAPPVTCIVADAFMPFTITAAEELKIPLVMVFTLSACGILGIKNCRHLMDNGLIPLKANGYLENIVEGIPGMKDIRLRDFSSFIRTTDPNEFFLNFTTECTEKAVKASAILVQTFDALEQDVLDGLSLVCPRVYSIGPLQLLLNQVKEPSMKSVKHNFWKEETQCLAWLDSKGPSSVIYVNFGSLTVLTEQQLLEFGMGLANSKQNFLWIVRTDLVTGGSAILPKEFTELSEGRGFIASWCPQEEVLNHPSIGGFLTHCGWNSTLESLSAGVPMLCWPFFADQPTNCRFACKEWGIGMEMDNDVKRDEVENLVRELMEGERGKKLKNKAMEWKKLAEEATGPHGSSRVNLDKFVNEVLLH